jgi:hypothetical protein
MGAASREGGDRIRLTSLLTNIFFRYRLDFVSRPGVFRYLSDMANTKSAIKNMRQTERRTHVRVDVEGYRARQLEKLKDKCRDAIAEVRETAQPVRLEPMDPYERKLMHDLVAGSGGVTSVSEGTEPRRRVVIKPEGA